MTAHAAKRATIETQAPGLEVGVAHDFKNLLFVITAHCQRLIQTLEPEDIRRRDAEAIAVAADRAVALTRQLLETGRAEAQAARSLDLNVLLGDLQGLLGGLVGERVSLRWSLSQDLWAITGNQTQVEQVVVNLVANARDAMPDGGTVTIGTENQVVDEGERRGEFVVLTVSDTGLGMPPEVRARIFEPYFTTKGADGTGVGLATVQAIVRASGGRIEVASTPHAGTTMRVLLPRGPHVLVMPLPMPPQPSPVRQVGTRPRVLLVDDEPAVRDLLAHCLELEGYEPIVAGSGQEAIEILNRQETALDAVVTDLNLPDVGGAVVVAESRRCRPDAGVFVISGASEGALAGMGEGVPILMKPFSLADFKRIMRAAVGERRPS